jgi:hypothetical protein
MENSRVSREEDWNAKSPRAPREDRLGDILFLGFKLVFLGGEKIEEARVSSEQ